MNLKTKRLIRLGKFLRENKRFKSTFKLFLKIAITIAALYFVVSKIDVHQLVKIFGQIHLGWLLLAILAFAGSKLISAFRLNHYFRIELVYLTEKNNIYLYWLGMFYNLFLPGGIGGDGYKVYWLNKQKEANVKRTILSILLDRISGLGALVFLALATFIWLKPEVGAIWFYLAFLAICLLYPIYLLVTRLLFQAYTKIWFKTSLLSIGVQLSQLVCVLCILMSLNIHDHWPAFLFIFLVSSIVAVLPLTIGGLGSREIVFLISAEWFALTPDISVSISLIFYLITALVALLGGYFVLLPKYLEK